MVFGIIKQEVKEIRKKYLFLYSKTEYTALFKGATALFIDVFSMESLDHIDLQILRTLQDNARLTTKELAARVHLSTTPVFERLKRLEAQRYIKK